MRGMANPNPEYRRNEFISRRSPYPTRPVEFIGGTLDGERRGWHRVWWSSPPDRLYCAGTGETYRLIESGPAGYRYEVVVR